MPKSVNKVILVGNVGKDPEVRYSQSGTPVANFSLATNERFKDRNDEWQERTEWHSIVAWQRLAEIVGEYVAKGSKVYVEGKLQTTSWEDRQSGERKYRTEIVARDLLLLGPRENSGGDHQRPTHNENQDQRFPRWLRRDCGPGYSILNVWEIPAHLYEGRAVMSPANGHANDPANGSTTAVQQFAPPASDTNIPTALTPNAAKIKELIANLEVPFHPSVIEWRVTNTSKGGSPRGQVMPYADQRAYTDRLNALFTPAGWTRRYAVHTSANFERSKDQKVVAKVLVTCELTIFGLGHTLRLEKSGPTTIMQAQLRKHRHSNEPVHVLDWGAICITSLERGSIWTSASARRVFRNLRAGQRLKDGGRVFGPTRRLPQDCPSKQLRATTGMAMAMQRQGANDNGASLVREIEQMERSAGETHVSRTA